MNELFRKLNVTGQTFLSQRKLSRLDSGSRSISLVQKNDDVFSLVAQTFCLADSERDWKPGNLAINDSRDSADIRGVQI